MCGIAGYYNSAISVDKHVIDNMLRSIAHRGPDDSGVCRDEFLTLGQNRLSIIDLSDAGHQPMVSECGNYILIYNGEVYNFKEIKQELERAYNFKSNSDTEVILYAIIEYGVETALNKFNGMFAFAFYDLLHKKLYLARDKMGVKPLFYYSTNNELVFSSELKSLYHHPKFVKNIDKEALSQFLQYGYIPSPRSIYENCYKLDPASYLEVDVANLDITKNKYWDINNAERRCDECTYEEYVDKTVGLLNSSVEYRMIADVPVASFLSGGIDSSLVTALMKERNDDVQTFTIGFHDGRYNEADKAKQVAEYLGTKHHECYCSLDEVKKIIPELVDVYDEPFADSSSIPTILLSRFTSNSVKVAMSADGGDELFGGYNKYMQYKKMKTVLKFPLLGRRLLSKGAAPLSGLINRFDKIEGLLNSRSSRDVFKVASTAFQDKEIKKLLKSNAFPYEPDSFDSDDFMNDFMLYDMKYLLEGDILTKVDRATMNASVESREPLLDYRLVELSAQIPSVIKFRHGQKSILKDIARKHIPSHIINMPKQGFNVPMGEWLKGDLKSMLDYYLSFDKIDKSNLFNTEEIIKIKERFLSGKEHVYKIWYLLSFMMWLEKENYE